MKKLSAVVIKGNPRLITRNRRATAFYKNLKVFLEKFGFGVTFNAGLPGTVPKVATLWVAHSRGADRLRFVPKSVLAIGVAVPKSDHKDKFSIINHPKDELVKQKYNKGKLVWKSKKILSDKFHYILSRSMKQKIKKIIEKNISATVR